MNARTIIAGAAALVALAAVGVGAVSAQPRDDKPSRGRTTDDTRFDADDFYPCDGDCFFGGPGWGGRGWMRGGPGFGGPGMRGRGFGGPGMHGPGFGRGGWGGPGFGGMGPGFDRGAGLLRGGERIARALDLSDAQRKKLQEIREDHHRAMIRARADMDLARIDLGKMLQEDASMASIERQIDALARMHADQMKSMVATHRVALDVLNAKQRERLKELRGWGDGDDDARPRRGSRR